MSLVKYEVQSRAKHMVYIDDAQMVFNAKVREDFMKGVKEVELYYDGSKRMIGVKINDLGEERVEVQRYDPDRRPRVYCRPFLQRVVKVNKFGNHPVEKKGDFLFINLG